MTPPSSSLAPEAHPAPTPPPSSPLPVQSCFFAFQLCMGEFCLIYVAFVLINFVFAFSGECRALPSSSVSRIRRKMVP